MQENEEAKQVFCLPTDSAVALLKTGTSMPDVVAQLGDNAWQHVPLSALGKVTTDELNKIGHLSTNWAAVVSNYLICLENTYGAAGNSI